MSQELSDSVWNHKPWWCQPWSIALTGCSLIAGLVVFVPWIWAQLFLGVIKSVS